MTSFQFSHQFKFLKSFWQLTSFINYFHDVRPERKMKLSEADMKHQFDFEQKLCNIFDVLQCWSLSLIINLWCGNTHTGSCIHCCPYFHASSSAVKTHEQNIHVMTHIFILATISHNTLHLLLRHVLTPWLVHIYVDIMHQPTAPNW